MEGAGFRIRKPGPAVVELWRMTMFSKKPLTIPSKADALPGRAERMPVPDAHFVNRNRLSAAVSRRAAARALRHGLLLGRGEEILVAARRLHAPRSAMPAARRRMPTYREVCTGMTGHNEVVLVVFDPTVISYERAAEGVLGEPRPDAGHAAGQRRRHPVPLRHLLFRRGAEARRRKLARRCSRNSSTAAGYGAITTEILPAPEFYYAEDYHQQYLAKNPDGYCGLGGTGVSCPVGVGATA